jgi:hypothetical protein
LSVRQHQETPLLVQLNVLPSVAQAEKVVQQPALQQYCLNVNGSLAQAAGGGHDQFKCANTTQLGHTKFVAFAVNM